MMHKMLPPRNAQMQEPMGIQNNQNNQEIAYRF